MGEDHFRFRFVKAAVFLSLTVASVLLGFLQLLDKMFFLSE